MARTSAIADGIAEKITTRIEKGQDEGYRPGQWLPTAGEIGDEFGVHRATIGRVLKRLSMRGLVVLYPNKGARVAKRHDTIIITAADILEGAGDWRGFPASVYRVGGQPFNDITSAGEVPAPGEVATRLGIAADTTVYARTRIQGEIEKGHRVPIQLSWSWYTMELVERVPAIRATPLTGPSNIRRSVADAGYLVRYDGRAGSRFATAVECELLELAHPAIVFEIWRTCFDETGRPIEVSKLVDDADKVVLAYSYSPITE